MTAETDWGDTITAASANAYNEATAAIPTGLATEDWVTAQGYLTAHQSLADYQTTADMVNYQTTAGMTAYQEAGEYYSASNPSGFITTIPDTYLQNTDLATTDGKVTAISGIPLSAGGDVPEGVMVESGLEYNAVNEISGYNGSAIAQYGAEKQWLVHDDTLVHASNSAQYALGVAIDNVARLMGIDETELLVSTANGAFTLSEPFSSFNGVKMKLRWWDKVPDNYYDVERFTTAKCSLSWTYFDNLSDGGPLELAGASWTSNNGSNYNLEGCFVKTFNSANTAVGTFTAAPYPLSIVGIGRRSNT